MPCHACPCTYRCHQSTSDIAAELDVGIQGTHAAAQPTLKTCKNLITALFPLTALFIFVVLKNHAHQQGCSADNMQLVASAARVIAVRVLAGACVARSQHPDAQQPQWGQVRYDTTGQHCIMHNPAFVNSQALVLKVGQ